jgi:hypothetical protein
VYETALRALDRDLVLEKDVFKERLLGSATTRNSDLHCDLLSAISFQNSLEHSKGHDYVMLRSGWRNLLLAARRDDAGFARWPFMCLRPGPSGRTPADP